MQETGREQAVQESLEDGSRLCRRRDGSRLCRRVWKTGAGYAGEFSCSHDGSRLCRRV